MDFKSIHTELKTNLKSFDVSYDMEQETLMDFKSDPGVEIGPHKYNEGEWGIYMAFSPNGNEEDKDSILDEFLEKWAYKFIKPLTDYLSTIYSENTNSDACSYQININTNHMDTSEEAIWEITVEITDALS